MRALRGRASRRRRSICTAPESVEQFLELGIPPERINSNAMGAAVPPGVQRVGRGGRDLDTLGTLAAMVVDGAVEIPIAGRYPLDRVAEAFTFLEGQHLRGKVVVGGNGVELSHDRCRRTVTAWMNGYLRAWDSNAPDDIRALFTDDAEYLHGAVRRRRASAIDAIVAGWIEDQDQPGDHTFTWSQVGHRRRSRVRRGRHDLRRGAPVREPLGDPVRRRRPGHARTPSGTCGSPSRARRCAD